MGGIPTYHIADNRTLRLTMTLSTKSYSPKRPMVNKWFAWIALFSPFIALGGLGRRRGWIARPPGHVIRMFISNMPVGICKMKYPSDIFHH
jgi:hypothetical protein